MIQKALREYEQINQEEVKFSILWDVLEENNDRMQSFSELEIILPDQLCSIDFNMDTTLYRGLKLMAVNSV